VKITQPNDGVIIQTRTVKISWNFTDNGVGCGTSWGFNCAGNSTSFKIIIDDNSNFSSPIINKTNIPSASRTYTTTAADGLLTDNKTYYAKVCAVNYKEGCATLSFTKQAYPVGVIVGVVGE
jgi:hypothetical protein